MIESKINPSVQATEPLSPTSRVLNIDNAIRIPVLGRLFRFFGSLIAGWNESRRAAGVRRERQMIESAFRLSEKDGRIYILHDAEAIVEFGPDVTSREMIERIRGIRATAVTFSSCQK